MKTITNIVLLGILLTFLSCEQKVKKPEADTINRELIPNPEGDKKSSSLVLKANCNFDKFLNSSKTPKIAKELFRNTAKYTEEPLLYFDSLKSTEKDKREFYFRVITNSRKIADGAYSEGLSNLGKEYIENNTKGFVSFFDNTACFTDQDLVTWADIVVGEFSIIGEGSYDKPIIDDYTTKLKTNCMNCNKKQKETINKFSKIVKAEWQKYLKSIDY